MLYLIVGFVLLLVLGFLFGARASDELYHATHPDPMPFIAAMMLVVGVLVCGVLGVASFL